MKIEEVRTSFTVYLIASELDRLDGIAESLRLAGYMTASFKELSSAFSEFPSNPPHFLLFDAQEKSFQIRKAVQQVIAQLPESHIFVLTEFNDRDKIVPLLEEGVYDLLYMPLVSEVELIQALDRAAERDYFMYTNERLMEQVSSYEASDSAAQSGEIDGVMPNPAMHVNSAPEETNFNLPPVPDDLTLTHFTSFTSPTQIAQPGAFGLNPRHLFDQRTPEDAIAAYMNAASHRLESCGIVFFRFIANRRVLMATRSHGLQDISIDGVGVNFNEVQSDFRSSQLREPHKIQELSNLIVEVFESPEFFCHPVEALGEVQGVMVYLRREPVGPNLDAIKDWLALLNKSLSLQEAEKRLHSMSVKDAATDLLNRQNFVARVQQEISRSRRTLLPVSLALITLDQYGQIVTSMGSDEAQTVLRMAARIIEKHSRVTDIIGRTGADEFGVILPHTGRKGALIKVERLRRIMESADFTRVLKEFPSITVSVGVSEYPSMVRDAEELITSADEALYQVRSVGNRTCVSKPPDGFEPDFAVVEKGTI